MKILFLILQLFILFFFSGCLYPNETGVSKWHYNRCEEYYDIAGQYHKECDNLFEYKDLKKLNPFRDKTPQQTSPFGQNNCELGDCAGWN